MRWTAPSATSTIRSAMPVEEVPVVRDEDRGAFEALERSLEHLDRLDVEVIRRLVEQQAVGASQHQQEQLQARPLRRPRASRADGAPARSRTGTSSAARRLRLPRRAPRAAPVATALPSDRRGKPILGEVTEADRRARFPFAFARCSSRHPGSRAARTCRRRSRPRPRPARRAARSGRPRRRSRGHRA